MAAACKSIRAHWGQGMGRNCNIYRHESSCIYNVIITIGLYFIRLSLRRFFLYGNSCSNLYDLGRAVFVVVACIGIVYEYKET